MEETVAPRIQIDDDVFSVLKSNAEPFVDTPNSVLRRLLGMAAGANGSTPEVFPETEPRESYRRQGRRRRPKGRVGESKRAQSGTILPHDGYELPILAIVDEHGRRAPTREVLDELGKRLEKDLMPADYEKLASGDIRWRNRAQFVRLRLIERGDMKKDSPRGLWEITDQGRDRLVAQ
ncbi:MAG TPA: winged helix-turn-helix domain-containing protein [Gaiellaceae bacterium]